MFSIKNIQFSGLLFLDRVFRLAVINFSLLKRAVATLQPVRAFFYFRCSFAAFLLFLQNSPYIQAGSKNSRVPTRGTLVQYITSTCPVGAGCGASWASSRLSTPVRKKCIFSRKKFVQPVRSVLVRTRTANRDKLRRVIVYISGFRTPYEPYRLFELCTRFFRMRTEQSSSHCANLIVTLPQETFPLGESSKSPLYFAAHRDESVIVGYYTSAEVHLRYPSPLDEP